MKRVVFIILSIGVELFVVLAWMKCPNLDQVHFSGFDLYLRLIEAIHSDQGLPAWMARFFHNKVFGTIIDLFGNYVALWSLPNLVRLFSFVGVFGMAANFYYFISRSLHKATIQRWEIVVFVLVLLIPFIEIFQLHQLPVILRLIVLVAILGLWSLLGIWHFFHRVNKKRFTFFILLLTISIWYQLIIFPSCLRVK